MTLERIVLTFGKDGIQVRALYRTKSAPNPGTKARSLEVTEHVRTGLREGLRALDAGDVVDLGTSGFTTREDTFLCTNTGSAARGVHKKPTKGAA